MQYYGAGVQACYRGPRLYDTEETKEMVKKTIEWYKQYRGILNSDIIQLRRADGRDWDGFVHVNPRLQQKGFLMLYNPLKEKITRTIRLPLYYTGLTHVAMITDKNGMTKKFAIDRNEEVEFTFTIEADGFAWFVIK